MAEQIQSNNHEFLEVDTHISLRAVAESEAGDLFELTDNNREYLAEFLPWVYETLTEADSLEFIRKIQNERAEGSQYGFGMYCDSRLVGHMSLMHVTDEKKPEIGYWIAEDYSGKGITTRATKAVEDFGFGTLGLSEIVIKARIDNVASNAIPKKLGYVIYETEQGNDGSVNVWRKTNE